jgi:hypothetical protein
MGVVDAVVGARAGKIGDAKSFVTPLDPEKGGN